MDIMQVKIPVTEDLVAVEILVQLLELLVVLVTLADSIQLKDMQVELLVEQEGLEVVEQVQ